MERILIIGGNGCGKTTLSNKLANKLSLPLIHLDALYWNDNWKPVSDEEFDRLLMSELVQPRWIIDGNISRTIPLRLQYCDAVIFMDFSRIRCLTGVVGRFVKNYGKSRTDMGGNCLEKLNAEKIRFIKGVWTHHKETRRRFYDMMGEADDVKIVILKNRRETDQFLSEL